MGKQVREVHATHTAHTAHTHPRLVVLAQVIPLPAARVGQDVVSLDDELELLLVSAFIWMVLETLPAVRLLDLDL